MTVIQRRNENCTWKYIQIQTMHDPLQIGGPPRVLHVLGGIKSNNREINHGSFLIGRNFFPTKGTPMEEK